MTAPEANAAPEIFAVLDGAVRVWAIAAIHGDVERLRRLHDVIGARLQGGDRIVYLGNMIGRGARTCETMDELLAFRRHALAALPASEGRDIVYLRGMQEEMWRRLMEIHFAQRPAEVFAFMRREGIETILESYGVDLSRIDAVFRAGVVETVRWTGQLRGLMRRHDGHEEIIAHLRRAAYTPGGEVLLVSAGVDIARPLDAQGDAFWWGSASFAEFDEPYAGFARIVRGYDHARRPARMGRHVAHIDGGAGFGGTLNAACLALDGSVADWIEV